MGKTSLNEEEMTLLRARLEDMLYADGFVGYSSEEWEGVKKFIRLHLLPLIADGQAMGCGKNTTH